MEQEDYPEDFEQFIVRFATEQDCYDYISKIRWANGFTCPRCCSSNYWRKTNKRPLMVCASCGLQTSITAGTIFQGTRKPLRLWFHVMWWMMSQKTGASAKNLQHTMGFKRYETAWTWLHKLRHAMIRPGRDRLIGAVEVDETFIGGAENDTKGRETETKTLVAIGVELEEKKLGRIRFKVIPDASADSLIPFIKENITPGSCVITDGWLGYAPLRKENYQHVVHNISQSDESASTLLPHVHLVVSLIKRWLMGTHQGAVSQKHLSEYLDEYAFRFNRRLSTHRGKLFYRLMQQAVSTEPTFRQDIVS
ncbi:IS1595 family transposase [Desulfomarina profundi]|uniref:IS1595 family transposase n=1 Tax=Desulfomarina profundi TaxID=2772557 RepID=UPI0038B30545